MDRIGWIIHSIIMIGGAIISAKYTLYFISENNPIAIISGGMTIVGCIMAIISLYFVFENKK